MHKFNLIHSAPDHNIRQRRLETEARSKRIMRRVIFGVGLAHLALFDEATAHIAKKTALEAIMVVTNQPANNKAIIRNNFEIVEEREKRRLEGIRKNKTAFKVFQKRIKPILDGSLASADRLVGENAPEKLIAEYESLALDVKPKAIEKSGEMHTQALNAILEEAPGPTISRGRLHSTIDHIAPGDAYELSRSSSTESAALGFVAGTQNCDSRNLNTLVSLLRQDPNALKNSYVQQFADHVRLLYRIGEHLYILERGVNRFPDAKSLEVRTAIVPAAGYLAVKLTGRSISEVEGVQYMGEKTVFNDEIRIAISDFRLSYFQALDIAKGLLDFSGLGYSSNSQAELSKSILGPSITGATVNSSSEVANVYRDETGEASDPSAYPEPSPNDDDKSTSSAKDPLAFLDSARKQLTPDKKPGDPLVKNEPAPERKVVPSKIPQELLERALEKKKEDQKKIDEQLDNIEQGLPPDFSAEKSTGAMEVTFFEIKPLDKAEYQKFQAQYREIAAFKNVEQSMQYFTPGEKEKFTKSFFKNGQLSGSQEEVMSFIGQIKDTSDTARSSITQNFQDIFNRRDQLSAQLNVYTEVDTAVLLDLVDKQLFVAQGKADVFVPAGTATLQLPFKLSEDNLHALLKRNISISANLSRLPVNGLAILAQYGTLAAINVDTDPTAYLDAVTAPAKNKSLAFGFNSNPVTAEIAGKLVSLKIKLYISGEKITKGALEVFSTSEKPVVIPNLKRPTPVLLDNFISELKPVAGSPDEAFMGGQTVQIMLDELNPDLTSVLAKQRRIGYEFANLNLLKPEEASAINRSEQLTFHKLQNLSPQTAKQFKGPGLLSVPLSAVTPAALAALMDRPDGVWKNLSLNDKNGWGSVLEVYRASKRLAADVSPRGQIALKKFLQSNQVTLEKIRIASKLIDYHGELSTPLIVVSLEEIEKLVSRPKLLSANLLIINTDQRIPEEKRLEIIKSMRELMNSARVEKNLPIMNFDLISFGFDRPISTRANTEEVVNP